MRHLIISLLIVLQTGFAAGNNVPVLRTMPVQKTLTFEISCLDTYTALVNMNGRVYDPAVSQFLSPDRYVADITNSLDFNRYMYARNNPLIYTDPSGEFLLLNLFLFHTDLGYKVQKWISPVAVKNSFQPFGSNQAGIGVDVSVGLPQVSPISHRFHAGATYYWKNKDLMGNDFSGWETRHGGEVTVQGYMFAGLLPPTMYSYSGTTFNSKWSGKQTTNLYTIGGPIRNIQYENDYPLAFSWIPLVPTGSGDHGDRDRSAAIQINFGLFNIGSNIINGDGGPRRNWKDVGNKDGTYIKYDILDDEGNILESYDPDSRRMGTFYFGFGPFRIGRNSEKIRDVIQNKMAHGWITGDPIYSVLDLRPRWYLRF